jgi:hypothetical protein
MKQENLYHKGDYSMKQENLYIRDDLLNEAGKPLS